MQSQMIISCIKRLWFSVNSCPWEKKLKNRISSAQRGLYTWTEVKLLQDLCKDLLVRDLSCTICVHKDWQRLSNTNSIGNLQSNCIKSYASNKIWEHDISSSKTNSLGKSQQILKLPLQPVPYITTVSTCSLPTGEQRRRHRAGMLLLSNRKSCNPNLPCTIQIKGTFRAQKQEAYIMRESFVPGRGRVWQGH